jgi:DNA-binding NarL/FixJ family response regulator
MKNRIVIVDDHTLLRAGIRLLLADDPNIEVVGEGGNGRDAMQVVGELRPDLVVLDLNMPGTNGMEVIAELKRRHPAVRVLVMTHHSAEDYVHASLTAGANGYILKDASADEFRLAMQTVLQGKTFLSADISGMVVNGLLSGRKKGESQYDSLTHRERQVLALVAEGRSNKAIAEYLCLSIKTVEKHRSNLMAKLDLHNAAKLTAFALTKGLVGSVPVQ